MAEIQKIKEGMTGQQVADLLDSNFKALNEEIGSGGGGITVDDSLSDSSTNPVQNKVIKAELDKKAAKTDVNTAINKVKSELNSDIEGNSSDISDLQSSVGTLSVKVSALSGIDSPFVGYFDSAGKLPARTEPAWALAGDLATAKPYAYYVAGNVPSGYAEGWNDLSGVLGTYDFTDFYCLQETGFSKKYPMSQYAITKELYTDINDYDGYNIVELTGFGETGKEAGSSKVGDVYYNTSTKLLRELVRQDSDGDHYETMPFANNTIYHNKQNNSYWLLDGTTENKLLKNKYALESDYELLFFDNEVDTYNKERVEQTFAVISTDTGYYVDRIGETLETASVILENFVNYRIPVYTNEKLTYPMFKSSSGVGCVIVDKNDIIVWGHSNSTEVSGTLKEVVVPQNGAYFIFAQSASWEDYTISIPKDGIITSLSKKVKQMADLVAKVTKDFNFPLEMGRLNESNGEPNGASTNYVSMLSRQRTPLFLNITENDKINSIRLEDNESCKIFCYDECFAFLGYTSDNTLLVGTKYIKLELAIGNYSITDPEMPEMTFTSCRILHVNVTKTGELRQYKNTNASVANAKFNSFQVELPTLNANSDSIEYDGNQMLMWDNGYVMLPNNYTRDGEAVPLVIFAHGTGGYEFAETTPIYYYDLLKSLCYCGYAVADCSGQTAYYATDGWGNKVDTIDSKCNPLLLACYRGLYEWVEKNYNIRTDGCYILSKSSGGLVATLMSKIAPFRVRAVANLAPAICTSGASWRLTDAETNNFWMKLLGMPNPNVSTYLNSESDRQYVLENFSNITGYDPFFYGSTLNFEDILTLMYGITGDVGSTVTLRLENAYLKNQQLVDVITTAKMYQNVPMKIWVASDDDNVPVTFIKWYKKMVDNGNGLCHVRLLPPNTGKHHAVDTDLNAVKVDYLTKYNGKVNIPIAYAEAIDWFDRW